MFNVIMSLLVSCVLGSLESLEAKGVLLGKGFVPSEISPPPSNSRIRRDVCEVIPSQMSDEEQRLILEKHNQLRGSLQPMGADEFNLVWDAYLAARAQAWASKCIFKHDLLTDCDGNDLGQNLFAVFSDSKTPSYNLDEVVQKWYDEQTFYNFTSVTCEEGKVCGHYTQVVWSKTRRLGCGIAECPILENPGFKPHPNSVYVVCDYNPPGNYRGARPYASGLPCTECNVKDGGVKCQHNLCVPCLPKLDPECECPYSQCGNGGLLDKDNCRCICKEGFYGVDCSLACKDSSNFCSHWIVFCGEGVYKQFMATNCAKSCGSPNYGSRN